MPREILGYRGQPARCRIARSGAHQAAHRPQAGRDQAAVGERADAQRDLQLIVQEVRDAVGEHEFDRDVGEAARNRTTTDNVFARRGALCVGHRLQDRAAAT